MEPRYTHDCNTCVYLGQYKQYDLYYCAGEPTIVCRYSDEGPEYNSGLIFAVTKDIKDNDLTHYQVALVRALRKNDEIKSEIYDYFSKNHEQDHPEMFMKFLELVRISLSPQDI